MVEAGVVEAGVAGAAAVGSRAGLAGPLPALPTAGASAGTSGLVATGWATIWGAAVLATGTGSAPGVETANTAQASSTIQVLLGAASLRPDGPKRWQCKHTD